MWFLAYLGAGVVKWGCLGWSEVKVLRGGISGAEEGRREGSGERQRGVTDDEMRI